MHSQKLWTAVKAVFTLLLLASLTSVYARPGVSRHFEIFEDDSLTAKITVERTNEFVKVSIKRAGRPAHVYRTFIMVNATSVHIGEKKVITYFGRTGDVETRNARFNLDEIDTTTKHYGRSDIADIHRLLIDDMHLLRVVREYDSSVDVRLAELAFIATTGDYSISEGAPSSQLQVRESTVSPKSSAGNRKTKIVRVGFQTSFSDCKTDCETIRKNCVASVPINDRVKCFTNESECVTRCHEIYKEDTKPAPEEGAS